MRTLNIGCGEDISGTDFIDIHPRREGVIKCDVDKEKLPYPKNTFDKIICKYLFEHLRNPGIFLKDCYRVLKKGGKVYLETDNAGWFNFHNSKSLREHYGGYSFNGDENDEDKHFSLFTFYHIKQHLKDAGFKSIEVSLFKRDIENNVFGKKMKYIIKLISMTRFKWMSYAQIKAEAKK